MIKGWESVELEEETKGRSDDMWIDRVTVWMQHTSLPLTKQRENKTEGGHCNNSSLVQCIVWVSVFTHKSLNSSCATRDRGPHMYCHSWSVSVKAVKSTRRTDRLNVHVLHTMKELVELCRHLSRNTLYILHKRLNNMKKRRWRCWSLLNVVSVSRALKQATHYGIFSQVKKNKTRFHS